MNKFAYFVGKFSKKYRNWWLRRNKTWLWGIRLFISDFPPPPVDWSKIDYNKLFDQVKQYTDFPLDKVREKE